jgi:hypothetical protein
MSVVIIKNNDTTSTVDINDLGISIGPSSQRTLSIEFTDDELDQSIDLYDAVNAGTLIVNDGSSDLSSVEGLQQLDIMFDHEILKQHYTKTELQTSGQSAVNWGNITNAPSWGTPVWQGPAICRVEGITALPPAVPAEGMFYVDSDDNHLYRYTGGSWIDQGAPEADDKVINKANQYLEVWTGAAWQDTTASVDWACVVTDDGDTKQAQYVFSSSGVWVKIADVDWGDHGSLTGLGNDDHSQYHNDTRGDIRYYTKNQFIDSYTGLANEPILTDATGRIDPSLIPPLGSTIYHHDLQGPDAYDDHTQYLNNTRGDARYYQKTEFIDSYTGISNEPVLTDSTGKISTSLLPDNYIASTLDEAYDGLTGSGSGRTITVDSKAVKMDATSGTNAPLELVPLAANPSSDAQGGQIIVRDNRMYLYDTDRSKWLSVEKLIYQFGRGAQGQKSQWMRHPDSTVSNLSGPRIPRNATVIAMSVQTSGNSTVTFGLRKNGSGADLATVATAGTPGNQNTAVNIDFNTGDFISAYMTVTGTVDYPVLSVYVAWR